MTTPRDFKPGQHVTYVPNHANGDLSHEDCEHGVVTSINEKYVFVKFNVLALHGQACDPETLK